MADPFTGVKIVFDQTLRIGAGTSQAAPIWAGLTVLMNQYLIDHGGTAVGDITPLLYRVAAGSRSPGFHDITLGGNAVDTATEGYDLVTGLGTPDVENLARDLLDAQAAQSLEYRYAPGGGWCPPHRPGAATTARWAGTAEPAARGNPRAAPDDCASTLTPRLPDNAC